MSPNDWRDEIGPQVFTIQIIVAALTAGCLIFMAIAIFLVQTGQAPPVNENDMPLLTYMATAWAGMAIVARMIVPKIIESAARKRIADGTWQAAASGQQQTQVARPAERLGDAGQLLAVLNTRTIVGGAILEGSAFFALVAYLIEKSPLALAAAVVMIIGVVLHFPTRSSATHWIEDQLAAVEQLRQFGS